MQRFQEPEIEELLKEVRGDFAKDGQKWDSSHEKNLVNVWKKYKRTKDHLERKIEEFESHKKKMKKEFDELQLFVDANKQLQIKRDHHVKQLMDDNFKLNKQIKQNEIEREAYTKQLQSIADLLNTEGLSGTDFNPSKKVEKLLKEHESNVAKISKQEDFIKQVEEEKVTLGRELSQLQKEKTEIKVELEEQNEMLKAKEETLTMTAKTYDEQQTELESKTIELNALQEIKETLTKEVNKNTL